MPFTMADIVSICSVVIEKQREFYRNAKYVTKYKKTQKQQNLTSDHMPTTSDDKVCYLLYFSRVILLTLDEMYF